jgi:uncharacterized membrane protein
MTFAEVIDRVGQVMDGAGVGIIVVGALAATVRYLQTYRRSTTPPAFRVYRQALGRAVLLGLEFLVAGDIIRTVATDFTYRALGLLAVIILIRTFLSIELEMEIEGRWPWQTSTDTPSEDRA